MIERIFHYKGKEYHLVQDEIHRPLGVTNDIFVCNFNGCKDYTSGAGVIQHFIEKHTMKEFLEKVGLI